METTILYRAAMEGNTEILLQNKNQLESFLSPNNNTLLHVTSQFGHINCVMEILNLFPSMYRKANSDGDTALHMAAREGHSIVVRALVEYANALDEELEDGMGTAKDMMRMENKDGDTALHVAVRNHHTVSVQLLAREDSGFFHPENNAGETPLYVAAERGYVGLVFAILESCREPRFSGPGGRTALHAAVIHNLEGCTKKLLDWKPALTTQADEHGWTPLHYAAHYGHILRVKELLNAGKSAAYIKDKYKKKTPLHLATSRGHVCVMEELILQCPDCWEIVDGRGQNLLHIAVKNEKKRVIKFVLNKFPLSNLINQKDIEGNTPLHLLAASGCYVGELIKHPKVDRMAFNNENSTPLDVVYCDNSTESWGFTRRAMISAGSILGRRDVNKRNKEETANKEKYHQVNEKILQANIRTTAETQMIVAALIAIATFTAVFAILGSYNDSEGNNRGTAVASQKAAFKAFVITDGVALFFSISTVLVYSAVANDSERNKLSKHHDIAYLCIVIAIGAMVLAFVAGLYAVLGPSSGIAIALCVVGCLFFVINCLLLRKKWGNSH